MTDKYTISSKPGAKTKYEPEYCEKIVNFAKQGFNLYEIAEAFGVTRDTLLKWAKSNPDFAEAKNKARDYHLSYLTKLAKKNLLERDFNERTFELLYASAVHNTNLHTIKDLLAKANDPADKCQVIIDSILSGDILPERAEVIINMVLKLVSIDDKLKDFLRAEIEKKLGDK